MLTRVAKLEAARGHRLRTRCAGRTTTRFGSGGSGGNQCGGAVDRAAVVTGAAGKGCAARGRGQRCRAATRARPRLQSASWGQDGWLADLPVVQPSVLVEGRHAAKVLRSLQPLQQIWQGTVTPSPRQCAACPRAVLGKPSDVKGTDAVAGLDSFGLTLPKRPAHPSVWWFALRRFCRSAYDRSVALTNRLRICFCGKNCAAVRC